MWPTDRLRRVVAVHSLFLLAKIETLQREVSIMRDENEAAMVDLCMRHPAHALEITMFLRGEIDEEKLQRAVIAD